MQRAQRSICPDKYPRFVLWDAGEEKLGLLLVDGQSVLFCAYKGRKLEQLSAHVPGNWIVRKLKWNSWLSMVHQYCRWNAQTMLGIVERADPLTLGYLPLRMIVEQTEEPNSGYRLVPDVPRGEGQVVEISSNQARLGKQVWDKLPARLEAQARQLWGRIVHLQHHSFEEFERLLCCDEHPNRELAITEAMAEAMEAYRLPEGVTPKQVAISLLGISVKAKADFDPVLATLYQEKLAAKLPGDDGLPIMVGAGDR